MKAFNERQSRAGLLTPRQFAGTRLTIFQRMRRYGANAEDQVGVPHGDLKAFHDLRTGLGSDANHGMQVFGGPRYISRMGPGAADARLPYQSAVMKTNGIQALDLLGPQVLMKPGQDAARLHQGSTSSSGRQQVMRPG